MGLRQQTREPRPADRRSEEEIEHDSSGQSLHDDKRGANDLRVRTRVNNPWGGKTEMSDAVLNR